MPDLRCMELLGLNDRKIEKVFPEIPDARVTGKKFLRNPGEQYVDSEVIPVSEGSVRMYVGGISRSDFRGGIRITEGGKSSRDGTKTIVAFMISNDIFYGKISYSRNTQKARHITLTK
jgi:hypothetical protein